MKIIIDKLFGKTLFIIRKILLALGVVFLLMLIFAFTSVPYWMHYNLGTKNAGFDFIPDYIILLGGSGMPSESNLMRAYFTTGISREFQEAPIIVALPGDTADSASSVARLASELVNRGVDQKRIIFECEGINTRAQVLQITGLLQAPAYTQKLVVVTSPEHMRRSILCFKKAGFKNVGGYPAIEHNIESDLTAKKDELGGNKFIPEVNKSIALRYRFWSYFKLEIIVLREYIALFFYKLKGWI